MTGKPHAVAYHADALDQQGRLLPDRVWGWEMPVLVDRETLDEAREWARRTLANDERAAAVVIRESIQQNAGGSWLAGRSVERIDRDQLSPPEPATNLVPARTSHSEAISPGAAADSQPASRRAFPHLRPASTSAVVGRDVPPQAATPHRGAPRR